MAILTALQPSWILPSMLAFAGIICLADVLARTENTRGATERFLLNFVALPVGVLAILAAVARWAALGWVPLGIAIGVGVVSIGRSLREVPWTGVASLALAAGTGYLLAHESPLRLPLWAVLAAAGVVFLVAFVLLYLIELPLRVAGLVSAPRVLLVVVAVASFVGAALSLGDPVRFPGSGPLCVGAARRRGTPRAIRA